MRSPVTVLQTVLILGSLTVGGNIGPVLAQPAPPSRDIPQSLKLEHQETLDQLAALAKHRGQVGVEARKALDLFKKHMQREEEFILPPLTLLPLLADGKVTPDMKWAIAMADRIKAEREQIFQQHTQITDAMNALATAAQKTNDSAALAFARAAVADSLNDIELLEPMAIVVGDYLRAKLPANQ